MDLIIVVGFKREKEINKLISFIENRKVNIVAGLRRSEKISFNKTFYRRIN